VLNALQKSSTISHIRKVLSYLTADRDIKRIQIDIPATSQLNKQAYLEQ